MAVGKALKLFDDEPQWAVEAFAELGEDAESNVQDLTRHYQPSKPIKADPNFAKYGGGVQQVKILLDFMNLFPLEREHLDLVMAKDSTFDSLIDIIADLHHRKQQVQAGPYQSVNICCGSTTWWDTLRSLRRRFPCKTPTSK